MNDGALADAVVGLHFAFVLFVIVGGLLVLWRRWIMWLHLPALAWGAFVSLTGRVCPLTPLENAFRRRGGLAGYDGGFIRHYLEPVLYPAGLTRPAQVALALVLITVNLWIYALVLRGRRPPAAAQ